MNTCRKSFFIALCVMGLSSQALANNPCRDPWISELAPQVWGHPVRGSGETGECNINLYGRNWNSKDQLRSQMQQTKSAFDKEQLEFRAANPNIIDDHKFFSPSMQFSIGVSGQVPKHNWAIALPNSYVLSVERRCRPGYSRAAPHGGGGCIK